MNEAYFAEAWVDNEAGDFEDFGVLDIQSVRVGTQYNSLAM
jgi:hypothetical protein